MAIGYPVDQSSINAQAAALAVRLRNLAQDTNNFRNEVGALSLTGVGFTSGDATAMNTALNSMAGLAGIYYGTQFTFATNYDSALSALRGLDISG